MTGALSIAAGSIASVSLGIWIYLLVGRGGFWLARERDGRIGCPPAEDGPWPAAIAIVPARNEAAWAARSVGSLLRQDYPGPFRVVLVDDQSSDGTAEIAKAAARNAGLADRLVVVDGRDVPEGWTGKLWAIQQGIGRAVSDRDLPDYLLLTDADIEHAPDNLRRLVAHARRTDSALVSLMARLNCDSWCERALIPAFVFFFQMLFPFFWVNQPGRRIAAAAGGCMLVRMQALKEIGGIAAVRHEIIDDCALGRQLKARGPIWLGLTDRAVSMRPYESAGGIRRMVARTAYAQLGYSPVLLGCVVLWMGIAFVAPPALALFGTGGSQWAGAGAWAAMTLAYQPILRFYRLVPLWAVLFPIVATVYAVFTVDSAVQHWRGKGGMWKGRAQAMK